MLAVLLFILAAHLSPAHSSCLPASTHQPTTHFPSSLPSVHCPYACCPSVYSSCSSFTCSLLLLACLNTPAYYSTPLLTFLLFTLLLIHPLANFSFVYFAPACFPSVYYACSSFTTYSSCLPASTHQPTTRFLCSISYSSISSFFLSFRLFHLLTPCLPVLNSTAYY